MRVGAPRIDEELSPTIAVAAASRQCFIPTKQSVVAGAGVRCSVIPDLARTLLAAVNRTRRTLGLRPLAYSGTLANAATEHAKALATAGMFTHDWPTTGRLFSSWIRGFDPTRGYRPWSAGEDLLAGRDWCYDTPGLAHDQYGCEQFASTLAWSFWPAPQNSMRPNGVRDESAVMAPARFRALVSRLTSRTAGFK